MADLDNLAGLMEQKKYDEVCNIIKDGVFHPSKYEDLIKIWDEAHYRDAIDRNSVKVLTPLVKFRIRKRNPPPPSICPEGVRPSNKMSNEARTYLREWFDKHPDNPYPSSEIRDRLASEAGVTIYQVKNWFANQRRRVRTQRATLDRQMTLGTNRTLTFSALSHQQAWERAATEWSIFLSRESPVSVANSSGFRRDKITPSHLCNKLTTPEVTRSCHCHQTNAMTSYGAQGRWYTHPLPAAVSSPQEHHIHTVFHQQPFQFITQGGPQNLGGIHYVQEQPSPPPQPLSLTWPHGYYNNPDTGASPDQSKIRCGIIGDFSPQMLTEHEAVLGLLDMGSRG